MRSRLLLSAATAFLLLFLLRFLDWPGRYGAWPEGAGGRSTPIYASPGTTLVATKVVFRDDGRKSWEFAAERIARTVDGLVLTATGISEGRVLEGEKVLYTFSAGALRYEVLTRRLTISAGLTGRFSEERGVFRAEEALVDTRRKELNIPGPVGFESEELDFSADGLAANLADETVVLKGNAVVRWSGGTMRAEEIRYSAKDGTFSVSGTEAGGVEVVL